jgi:ribonuclease Z
VRTLLHPFLPNGPAGDPVVWIDVLDEGTSLLIDMGDLRAVHHRKLLRVERAIVTHTHMDHFIGFDQLLRISLQRERELTLTGPAATPGT